jgi:Domain of unknown function (DUF4148)
MKRQAIAVLLGAAFALPAFANNEIDAGNLPQPVPAVKTRDQVIQELAAARSSGDWLVNSRLGTVSRPAAPTYAAGKSRTQVRAELERADRDGKHVAYGELGDTASHL